MYYLSNESSILKLSLRNKRINAGVKSTQVRCNELSERGHLISSGLYLDTELLLPQPVAQVGLEPMLSCTATIEQSPSRMS